MYFFVLFSIILWVLMCFKWILSCVCVCLYYIKLSWVTADLSRTIGGQWDRVLQDLVYAVPCLCVHVRLCSTVTVSARVCLWPPERRTPDLSHRRLPWVPFPYQPCLGFPCVTMITFTSTIKSRRTQLTVTHRGTPPSPLDPDEIWWQDLLSSAQP